MKKSFLLILAIIIACMFTSCTSEQSAANNSNNEDNTGEMGVNNDTLNDDFKVEIPFYDELKVYHLYYLDDSNILLCYKFYGIESKTIFNVFNIISKEFETIYTGKFPVSSDLECKLTERSYVIESSQGKLNIDKEDYSVSEVIYEKPTSYRIMSPDGKYTIIRDRSGLRLANNKNNQIVNIETVGRNIGPLRWSSDSTQFVYLADGYDIVVVDPSTTEYYILRPNQDFSAPEGLVDYLDISYLNNDKHLLLDGLCETSSALQIIDKVDGNLLWTYNAKGECHVFGVRNNHLVFADGPKIDKDVIIYDIENDVSEVIFDADDEYVVNAKISMDGSRLAILLLSGEEQYIHIKKIRLE